MYAVSRVTVPGGAYDALQQTHHAVLASLIVEPQPRAHGRQYVLRGTPDTIAVVQTLLRQIESGAWPGISDYGRLACRRTLRRLR